TCNTRTSVVDFPQTPSLTYHHVAAHRPLGEVTVELSRRDALRALATGATAAAGMAFIGVPAARADGSGTLIDYSAGVPSPESIRAAGYKGAIRYCSEPRAAWMHGKPMRRTEAQALHDAGLEVVSCYQYGKGEDSDWHGGYDA